MPQDVGYPDGRAFHYPVGASGPARPADSSGATGFDPNSQAYIDWLRQQAAAASNATLNNPNPFMVGADPRTIAEQVQPFMNPYQDAVIGGIRGEFDHLRGLASRNTAAQTTLQGGAAGRGGDRAALLEGSRLGALDRAQTSQVGNLLYGGYQQALGQGLNYSEYLRNLQERQNQEPLFRNQQAFDFAQQGLGPVGTTFQQDQYRNRGAGFAGGAMTGAGIGSTFGPLGTGIGAVAGGLLGLL